MDFTKQISKQLANLSLLKAFLLLLGSILILAAYFFIYTQKTIIIQELDANQNIADSEVIVPAFGSLNPLKADAAPSTWNILVVTPSPAYTTEVTSKMPSLVSYFTKASHSKFTVTYQIQTTDGRSVCSNAQATSAGINISPYNMMVYYMPPDPTAGPRCPKWGTINLGPKWSHVMNLSGFNLPTVIHEIGHYAFYFPHGWAMCQSNATKPGTIYVCAQYAVKSALVEGFNVVSPLSNPYYLNWGDSYDIMGHANTTNDYYNNVYRQRLGWLTGRDVPTTANTANTYTLYNSDPTITNSPQLLVASPYALEYKNNSLIVRKKCVVREDFPGGSTDGTCYYTSLAKGGIYYEPSNKMWIKYIDGNATSAQVFIGFNKNPNSASTGGGSGDTTPPGGTCQNQGPAVSINPTSKSGTPGTKLTYDVAIINRNCSSASFNLATTKPSGWTTTLSQTRTATLSAGASVTIKIDVTSPTSATNGSYSIGITATNTANTSQKTTSNLSYSVAKTAVGSFKANGVSPTLTIAKGANVTLSWSCIASVSARIKNADGTALANNTNFNPAGSFQVGHTIQNNKVYTLECFEKANFQGKKATASVSVNVR